MKLKKVQVSFALAFLVALIFLSAPSQSEAVSPFTPFGGKVAFWLPSAPGCLPITSAICIATVGLFCPTIESLTIIPPGVEVNAESVAQGKTIGILRVQGSTIPGITTIYEKQVYETPGINVLGNTINLCNLCGGEENTFTNLICGNEIVRQFTDSICVVSETSLCPVTNLLFKIGTSGVPIQPSP